MRLFPQLVAALAILPGALAVDQKRSAIIWFDDPNTPDSVVNDAKASIVKGGGKITHVYTIIKGFAVVAPVKVLESVQVTASKSQYKMRVDNDEMVSSQD
ncbi:hypothetical protein VFPFJ_06659 [Purpureocillium lilacinum]|nr:hypothetical protein VFPFJ_06659 [Purpureocillium lilacinum]OAQ88194.1 hypothetical protein VFPFJ_06659 [Purpureocillium lilacinum]GJN75119.1 hypothetical protein PLICBS_009215 [Purpureocillium lilacinum]GJN85147.1 hypothetical protein PLIIFM63780_008711 [Purpureocillium lilacinum]